MAKLAQAIIFIFIFQLKREMIKICDVEKYIDEYDKKSKNEMQSGVRLQGFCNEMKYTFHANLDELHMKFLDQYLKEDGYDIKDISLIKEIFDFLKTTI